MSIFEISILAIMALGFGGIGYAVHHYGLTAVEAKFSTFKADVLADVQKIVPKKTAPALQGSTLGVAAAAAVPVVPIVAPVTTTEPEIQSRITAAVQAALARVIPPAPAALPAPPAATASAVATVAALHVASAPATPAPTTGATTVSRDPFVIGPQVVAWGLPQQDNWGKPIPGQPGALTDPALNGGRDASIAVCDLITNYICANPSFTVDAAGFLAAYWKVAPAPVAVHPNPPLPITDAISAELVIYTTKCIRDCDKIGYLKLHGDLQNYLATNGLITAAWYQAADYATTSGTYDPVSGTQVTSPRVWE